MTWRAENFQQAALKDALAAKADGQKALTFLTVNLGDLDVCGSDDEDSLHEDRHRFLEKLLRMPMLGQVAEAALRVLYKKNGAGVPGPPTKRLTLT